MCAEKSKGEIDARSPPLHTKVCKVVFKPKPQRVFCEPKLQFDTKSASPHSAISLCARIPN